MKFKIDQISFYPMNTIEAKNLLSDMGLSLWAEETNFSKGTVFGFPCENESKSFVHGQIGPAPEIELLEYKKGPNYMDIRPNADPYRAAHIAMFINESEVVHWRTFFADRNIGICQEMNGHIIFNTHPILGIDVKFIYD